MSDKHLQILIFFVFELVICFKELNIKISYFLNIWENFFFWDVLF